MRNTILAAILIMLIPGVVDAALVYGTIEGDVQRGGDVSVECITRQTETDTFSEEFISRLERHGSYEIYIEIYVDEEGIECWLRHNNASINILIFDGANEFFLYHDGENLIDSDY